MQINHRFAIALSLAIASSLTSTLSQANADPVASSPINGETLAGLDTHTIKVAPTLKNKIKVINPGGTVQGSDEFKEAPLKFRESPGFVEFSKVRPGDRVINPAIDKVKPSAVKTINQLR
jgi:hypothetical protein